MKRIVTLLLAAGLVIGGAASAKAVDFNAKGQWIFGFGGVDTTYVTKKNHKNVNNGDQFAALQRLRLQLDAVASEALSGTVFFELGDTTWGKESDGGALGTDGKIVEVKRAYLDWVVPDTALSVRMGLQGVTLPNVAGGSSILDDDVAGITVSYKFNDAVSLTALWVRPFNDNFAGSDLDHEKGNFIPANYLDNADFFALMLPVTGDGWKVTPWAMLGFVGVNTSTGGATSEANYVTGMNTINVSWNYANGDENRYFHRNSEAYSTAFFAGLPIAFTGLDPWNFELDLNYGYIGSNGRYDVKNFQNSYWWGDDWRRVTNTRQGWLAKALVEYKMDWGTPGIFGWYGSGDDGNVKNGSERMPSISPCGYFTSFMGDGPERGWSIHNGSWGNAGYDQMLTYSGTWGVGLSLKDMSFLEDLKHTFRVAYWGGTNDPSMVKYLGSTAATEIGTKTRGSEGFYLTTDDHLIEFNLDSTYKIYENLEATLELGYIVNGIDKGTWNRYYRESSFQKGDAWKAAAIFNYSF